jgi:hypothetical protein
VAFEPTIAVLERAKTVRALDRSATAIGGGGEKKRERRRRRRRRRKYRIKVEVAGSSQMLACVRLQGIIFQNKATSNIKTN